MNKQQLTARADRLLAHVKIEMVACPYCRSAPGDRCTLPSGRYASIPHRARRSAAADAKVHMP